MHEAKIKEYGTIEHGKPNKKQSKGSYYNMVLTYDLHLLPFPWILSNLPTLPRQESHCLLVP